MSKINFATARPAEHQPSVSVSNVLLGSVLRVFALPVLLTRFFGDMLIADMRRTTRFAQICSDALGKVRRGG